MARRPASFRIDTDDDLLLSRISDRLTMSRAAVVRLMIKSFDAPTENADRQMLARVFREARGGR